MKRRNQIVNKLLAGVLIGGMTSASVAGAALPVFAAESEAVLAGASKEASGAEAVSESAAAEESADTASDAGQETEPADNGGSSENGSGDSGSSDSGSSDSGSADGGSSDSGSDSGSESGAGSSSDGGSGSGSSGSSTGESGSGESSSGDSGSSGSGSGESGSGDSGSGSGSSDSGSGENGSGSGSSGSGSDENDSGSTEESTDSSRIAGDSDDSGTGESLDGSSAAVKKSQTKIVNSASEAKKLMAEKEMAEKARREAEDEAAGVAARSYGYAYSNREYYSGSYFITEAQKRLALNIGFKQIGKVYAMPCTGVTINIREGAGLDQRIIGKLDKDGVCYVLEDDGSDWVFVESGEVRGFVFREILTIGPAAEERANAIGEESLVLAEQEVDPLENAAFRHTLNTTKEVNSLLNTLGNANADRQAMIDFAMQFLGLPYVWGGESLSTGTDCSGFTQQVYAQFGMSLPRCSYEQAEVGVKIPAQEALPGDLLFYARNGIVYHVLMYIGDGKAINESSSTTGCVISNVDYNKVCWACRYIADDKTIAESAGVDLEGTEYAASSTSLQAADLQAVGLKAYQGDRDAQEQIITALAAASQQEYAAYGFARSVIIAQAINETGWMSFPGNGAGILASDNNVLGMNAELNNSSWTSPWNGRSATRMVPQYRDGGIDYGFESMRLYDSVEDCMEDYAAFKVSLNPQLAGETDVDKVIGIGLRGYASDPRYQTNIKNLIDKYDLTRFDEAADAEAEEAENAAAEEAAAEAAEGTAAEGGENTDTETPDADSADVETPDADTEPEGSEAETANAEPDTEDGEAAEIPDEEAASGSEAHLAAASAEAAEAGPDEEFGAEVADDGAEEAQEVADAAEEDGGEAADDTYYTMEQKQLIYAIVAEEDDTSYEGALAVISSVMNRADANYGGYGTGALAQLTADAQYRYSKSVDPSEHYKKRLKDNVPDFVIKAVDDCLNEGIRNTSYNSFSETKPAKRASEQIGINYFYNA